MQVMTPERKQRQVPPAEEAFRPVNDEYQPFTMMDRRDFMQERLEVPIMVKALKLPSYQRILEIGCGCGIALVPLAELCHPSRLVGIDIDKRLLKQAGKRLKAREVKAELYQEDVRRLPFVDESFDIVVDFGTCYHINRRVKALREISRVLIRGGIFVQETPLNQFLSHPVRSFRKRIPWKMAPQLTFRRTAIMWSSRVKHALP